MKIGTFFIGFFGALMLICCAEEPPKLPSETQTGNGTFGCLVNGELLIQESGYRAVKPYGELTDGQFTLMVHTEFGRQFEFFVSQPQIGNCTIDSVVFYPGGSHYYMARNVKQMNLTKFDRIASGTFSFDADCYETGSHVRIPDRKIHVSKGRFDVCFVIE